MELLHEETVQYCGFKIAGEEFAIPVMDVQEVIKPLVVTPIPLASDEIRGLINLRGQIVTCLSLRRLFGKEDKLDKSYMNIIVRGNTGLFSLVVDEVTDIIDVDHENIEPAPDTIKPPLKQYTNNIYKRKEGLVILLNTSSIMEIKKEVIDESISN